MFAMEAQSFTIAALRLTNRTAPAGPSAALARGWLDLGMLAMTTPFKRTARRWVDRAIAMSREHGAENDHAFMASRAGVLSITTARWSEAEAHIRSAIEVATNQGDRRLLDECTALLAVNLFFQARYAESLSQYTLAVEDAHRSGTRQVARWSTLGRADIAVRCGRLDEAIEVYDREIAGPGVMATELVWAHGMRALARLRSGDRAGAHADALASLALLDRSPSVAYWTQHGIHATGQVLLALSPPGLPTAAALRAVLHAQIIGGVVAPARPAAALLQGELLRRLGWEGAARHTFERARRLAGELGMPYEAALADVARAGCAAGTDRVALLQDACEAFLALGADGDARSTLDALRDEPG
jgi:tetratricopeptide (TPR) repeat protein